MKHLRWLLAALVLWGCGGSDDDGIARDDDDTGASSDDDDDDIDDGDEDEDVEDDDASGDDASGDDVGSSGGDGDGDGDASVPLPTCDAGQTQASNLPGTCRPLVGEPLPARHIDVRAFRTVFVDDLFGQFQTWCGPCHGGNAALGGFNVAREDFGPAITEEVVGRIRSDREADAMGNGGFMPPRAAGGMPFADRGASDPVVRLADELQAWLDLDKPTGSFEVEVMVDPAEAPYALCEDLAGALTNIGSCVPDRALFGAEDRGIGEALDARFAAMQSFADLPKTLSETDLFTLDSEYLAWYGVLSYAPGYTLWADNAKKMRYVRVPRGSTIAFDPEAQTFRLPTDTRLYKTFLKEVVDVEGNTAYRKMETRLIVVRADVAGPEGTQTRALFGTYAWNDDETEATLVEDPYRSGEPFADRLVVYPTREPEFAELTERNPPNVLAQQLRSGYGRHYAIPGRDRCLQCHMGSVTADFVLGFSPLQLLRRPVGEGGVIDPSYEDELTQIRRFIDLGLVTGLDSPEAILPLEASQGDRAPRNEQELTAQGYMLGNCAHCHNPRGFPSVQAPELTDVLDFYPSTSGGIFQFPLNQTPSGEALVSPRTLRGATSNGLEQPMAYITPSLSDRSVLAGGSIPVVVPGFEFLLGADEQQLAVAPLAAPWRSLIYRNVDSPHTYIMDGTIFPHMPLHTPGYDCRSRRVIGEWMVSIPSRLKPTCAGQPSIDGDLPSYFEAGDNAQCREVQPFEEARAGDPDYEARLAEADERLTLFRNSARVQACTPGGGHPAYNQACTFSTTLRNRSPEEVDIVDEQVELGQDDSPAQVCGASVGNEGPAHQAHFIPLDTTEPPPPWSPRRGDWSDALVSRTYDPRDGAAQDETVAAVAEFEILELLAEVRFTPELVAAATTLLPMGTWIERTGCDLSSEPRLSEIAEPPLWAAIAPPGDRPLYLESRGGMLFRTICSNCHGQEADSSGRLAETLSQLTGGRSRVANFREGLFGPSNSRGANAERVFGPDAAGLGLQDDDLAARYLAWMALGGTDVVIVRDILNQVNKSNFLGVSRPLTVIVRDANMLAIAKGICDGLLTGPSGGPLTYDVARGRYPDYQPDRDRNFFPHVIGQNGDAEMWEQVCGFDNLPPVRGVFRDTWDASATTTLSTSRTRVYRRDAYPTDAPVNDRFGGVAPSLGDDNFMPWCIERPTDPDQLALAEAFSTQNELALCPAELVPGSAAVMTTAELGRWASRGAINAGLFVYAYLQARLQGEVPARPDFNRCEDL